jgi:methionine sulfoxide reductase heme-binding subunit
MLAVVNAKATWYLTRSTGLVSLLLLTASVLLGILEVSRWSSPRWPRFVTAGLHKNVSLLVIALLGVHILTAVVDGFALGIGTSRMVAIQAICAGGEDRSD